MSAGEASDFFDPKRRRGSFYQSLQKIAQGQFFSKFLACSINTLRWLMMIEIKTLSF